MSAELDSQLSYLTTKEKIDVAKHYFKNGQYYVAADIACRSLIQWVNLNDSTDLCWIWDFPTIAADLILKDNEMVVRWRRDNLTAAESAAYLLFVINYFLELTKSNSIQDFKPATTRRILLSISNLLNQFVFRLTNKPPHRVRVLLVRWLAKVAGKLYGRLEHRSAEILKLSKLLHLPVAEGRKIVQQNFANKLLRSYLDESPTRRVVDINKGVEAFRFLQEKDFRALMANKEGSIIVTTIHLGFPQLALGRLSRSYLPGSHICSIQLDPEPLSTYIRRKRTYGILGIDYDYIDTSRLNPLQLIGRLRRKETICHLFFDLPTTFGTSVIVNFFNKPARFPVGVAKLATVGHSTILPIFTYFNGKSNVIEVQQPINPKKWGNLELDIQIKIITQRLVTSAERYIKMYPDQWLFTSNMQSYFLDDGECERYYDRVV